MIRLLSVPHSGTRFMVQLLQEAGLTRTHAFWGDGDFIQLHFDGRRNQPIIYRETGVIIIPMRKREEVEASWRRRSKGLSDLNAMWKEMDDFTSSHREHIYFVHIDDPDRRDVEIQELSEKLNLFLLPDWDKKVGQGE